MSNSSIDKVQAVLAQSTKSPIILKIAAIMKLLPAQHLARLLWSTWELPRQQTIHTMESLISSLTRATQPTQMCFWTPKTSKIATTHLECKATTLIRTSTTTTTVIRTSSHFKTRTKVKLATLIIIIIVQHLIIVVQRLMALIWFSPWWVHKRRVGHHAWYRLWIKTCICYLSHPVTIIIKSPR